MLPAAMLGGTGLAGTVLGGTGLPATGLGGTGLGGTGLGGTILGGTGLCGTILGGTGLGGTESCGSPAACLAFGACDGRAMAVAVPPAEGPPPGDSSSPADTAAAEMATTLTVIAARFFRFVAAPVWRRDTTNLRFASS
jgi:hypothetical protein